MPQRKMADDEVVCPKPAIEEHCLHSHCQELLEKYTACADRVKAKGEEIARAGV